MSENSPLTAIADEEELFYAIQFHPEVAHNFSWCSATGNFVKRICGCRGDWTSRELIGEILSFVRAQVGENGRVICGLSGGVDSAVSQP